MLYNFRANHRLSTNGAAANGGWDAPNFPFRTHMQGHFLSAWAQAYAVTGDTDLPGQGQLHGRRAGQVPGQQRRRRVQRRLPVRLPGVRLHSSRGRHTERNVSYYCIHKTLAGLLDVWRYIGSTQARDVLLALAGWVDSRTGRLSYAQMQTVLGTEFGGMNTVLTDLYQQTGDARWLTAAQRFDHAAVVRPAGRQPGPAQRASTRTPRSQVDRRRPGVQGHRHHPLPRHRQQRVEHHRQRPHVRHRRQQPGRALPRPQRDRRLPRQRHLRALQHLQHAQADPGAVAARPEQRRVLRLLRAGAAQPHHRRAEPGRHPRAHHLLHPAQARAAGAAWARRGAAAPGAPTTTASGAARAPASRSTPS